YPLQLVTPPEPTFLNSSFANVEVLRRAAGEPTLQIPATDAVTRGLRDARAVRVLNDRGSFLAKAVVGETVKAGVVVSQSIWWNKYAADRRNSNATTSTRLTDFGAAATFFDNLVQVEGVHVNENGMPTG